MLAQAILSVPRLPILAGPGKDEKMALLPETRKAQLIYTEKCMTAVPQKCDTRASFYSCRANFLQV
jgi:hypothetical protein